MSVTRQFEATPGKVAEQLAELEPATRQGEVDQLAALAAVIEALVPVVSKRERVHVTLIAHDAPAGEGFNPRYVSLTISRVDPEAIRQREEAEAVVAAAAEAEHEAEVAVQEEIAAELAEPEAVDAGV